MLRVWDKEYKRTQRLPRLAAYNQNNAIYKCPADITLFQGQIRQRSVSMNSAVGTVWWSGFKPPRHQIPGSAVGGGWLASTYSDSQTAYRTYGKTSSFTAGAFQHVGNRG